MCDGGGCRPGWETTVPVLLDGGRETGGPVKLFVGAAAGPVIGELSRERDSGSLAASVFLLLGADGVAV